MLSWNQITLLIVPWLLLGTTYLVYQLLARRFGKKRGYLGGFLSYWIGWCLLFPLVLLGPHALVHLFGNTSVRVLLQWPHPFKSSHRMSRYGDVTAEAPLAQGMERKQRNGYVTPSTSSYHKR